MGYRVGSGHLELLAWLVALHLLLWQHWAVVMTHHQENQGQLSDVSIGLLPWQVTWGALGRKGRSLHGAIPVCL